MKLHPCHLGKYFELKYGLPPLTIDFNKYRRINHGLSPVKQKTVHRYNGGKTGYPITVPTVYKQFLISKIQ